ncbi:hypothetical protein [Caviibacterium pharyngocola]|uniref:Uncharacterized protein n=1 Tax=Caviibacterium pharyngocola TaxID=28159 RepID=A0A2M8RTX3_9PAST|nr:hypothetical protein [Caviibacterium pharyngocola]PJG82322.1 hypothetical protein CVP04_09850 [Caviibacterium pharyngocola]
MVNRTNDIITVIVYAVLLLPFEIGLLFWLFGAATFVQVMFYSLLSYALIGILAFIWRNPFLSLLGLLFALNN